MVEEEYISQVKKKLPLGIKIVGIVTLILGIIAFIYSSIFTVAILIGEGMVGLAFPIVFLLFLLGLLYVISSVGILKLKKWGRIFGIIVFIITFIISVASIIFSMTSQVLLFTSFNLGYKFGFNSVAFIQNLIIILVSAIFSSYFIFSKKVKESFG